MTAFKANRYKTNRLKWLTYCILGIALLIFIIKYSEWHFISKFLISIPILINLLFDIVYLKKENQLVSELNFRDSALHIIDKNKSTKAVPYSNLKYSIRKRKFDKHKTEIELKIKKRLLFKTYRRIHIKNWEQIFEIEKVLDEKGVSRTEWKPKTLWGKYSGIFIDLLFIATEGQDIGMTEYQERSIKEVTQNPIENENNT
ncbi:hypothetical protein [Aquimarina litoralis]|uniref:hypothetical protein n=1 Tax=Aquimarina litoralis TaxID=584605 RepID=UPI001C55D19C|nr:hypothetical protein [Aquimarina litoralis]MBW1296297.1 hypothetical protein [Aquimarina litoralis]